MCVPGTESMNCGIDKSDGSTMQAGVIFFTKF